MIKNTTPSRHNVEITHPDKVLFPGEKITKDDLIKYYSDVSSYILPFLKDHPLIIQRFPNGIKKTGFIQQHPTHKMPTWFHTCKLRSKEGKTLEHFLCQDIDSLLYLANFGVVSFHRWQSTYRRPDVPDVVTIDLDPPKEGFQLACKAAKLFKKLLEDKKLKSFVMTTGSKGLHVLVPIKPKHDFHEIYHWIKALAEQVAEKYPKEFTLELKKNKRRGRLFLDVLRNTYGHSSVCPYSIRGLPGAPIATPLAWEELTKSLKPQKYHIKNIRKRLAGKDPWKDFGKYKNQSI